MMSSTACYGRLRTGKRWVGGHIVCGVRCGAPTLSLELTRHSLCTRGVYVQGNFADSLRDIECVGTRVVWLVLKRGLAWLPPWGQN